ncbi:MAG: alkaline phosphatase family protein [Opitutaceae bacterium]|nr:alkaline phosphatase family protein [Opitutaceae bacterium]
MKTLSSLLCLLGFVSSLAAAPDRSLLLISIDGLRPDSISEADRYGLKIPHLRLLWKDSAHASGVRGVLPSSTYPSHTSIVTGNWPAVHGVAANRPFDPDDKSVNRWYWYNDEIKVPAIWDAATAAGYEVASVSWPVTVGAPGIKYNIPEFAGNKTEEDVKIIRGFAGGAFMDALAGKAGIYLNDAKDGERRDWSRTRYLLELLRQHRPRVALVHLVALDHAQHAHRPFSTQAKAALEEIDAMVGEIVKTMRGNYPHAAVCVVSDHGFTAVDHALAIDAAFVRAGLITLKGGGTSIESAGLKDWVAMPWLSSGSVAIVMKNPGDEAARRKVKEVLDRLAADPANGIHAILDREAIARLGGTPKAEFWIDLKTNFTSSSRIVGANLIELKTGGTHGHVPTHAAMNSTFLLAGPGVRAGDIGVIDMRSIAPTLAAWLRAPFPSAPLPPLDLFSATAR